jgi:DNA-binding NarL/FixJ family response regulator
MDRRTWRAIAKELALSPQQIRIVEAILRGKQDKQIAAELGLSIPTVRTYLTRIFDRVEVEDRLRLVLRIFAMAQDLK